MRPRWWMLGIAAVGGLVGYLTRRTGASEWVVALVVVGVTLLACVAIRWRSQILVKRMRAERAERAHAETPPHGNRWFGEPWPRENYRASVCEDDRLRIPVPVGETCYLCDTPIVETDRGQESYGIGAGGKVEGPMYAHRECLVRTVLGCFDLVSTGATWSPSHVCTGQENYREDALRVWAWIQTHPLG